MLRSATAGDGRTPGAHGVRWWVMTGEQYIEVQSLSEYLGAQPEHVLELARLVAGDEQLRTWHDLSESGARELIANLKLYDLKDWWTREMSA